MTTAELQQSARLLAGLSPEQRSDVLKRLHDSILRRLEREQLRSDQE
jgi:hypothetical protein